MNMLPSRWPGEVVSYDAARRTCRVRIPGITDGSTEFPEATIEQAIGDKSEHTEIRILAGDRVWLCFECGDSRFPIVTGFRAKETGNETSWRRWHHANIELTADGMLKFNATNIELNGITTINGVTTVNGTTAINDTLAVSGMASLGGGLSSTGASSMTGTLTNNGVNVGSRHTHTEQGDGAEVSNPH